MIPRFLTRVTDIPKAIDTIPNPLIPTIYSLVQKSVALPTEPNLTQFKGCFGLHHCVLRTRVDEYCHVQTYKNILWGTRRLSFHFKQVPFRSMLTLLRYWRDSQTDNFSVLYTVNGERFAGLNFCVFHGFQYRESLSVNISTYL